MQYANGFKVENLGNGGIVAKVAYDADGKRIITDSPLFHVLIQNSGLQPVTLVFAHPRFPDLNGSFVLAAGQNVEFSAQFDGEISQDITIQAPAGYTVQVTKTLTPFTIKLRNV